MAEEQPEGEVPMARRWQTPGGIPPTPPAPPAAFPPPGAYPPSGYPPAGYPPYGQQQYAPPAGYAAAHPYMAEYAQPTRHRPGIVTTMGVLSIVFGSLGLLANLVGGLEAMGLFMFNKMATQMAKMPAPGVAAPTVQTEESAYDRGLSRTDRQTVVSVFSQMPVHPVSAARQLQLDALLERGGKDMVPLPAGQYTPVRVRQAVMSFGEQPGVAYGSVGQQYFVTAGGRIELLDDRGVFRPADGSESVRVAMSPDNSAAAPAQNGGQSSSSVTAYSYTSSGTTTVKGTGPTTMPGMPRLWAINPSAIMLVVMETILNFLLAIFLLISGILAVRSTRAAGRMHLIYAILKIPAAIFGAIAWSWMMNSFMTGMMAGAPAGTARPPGGVFGVPAAVSGAFALAYPIALLIMLSTRTLRDYYGQVRSS